MGVSNFRPDDDDKNNNNQNGGQNPMQIVVHGGNGGRDDDDAITEMLVNMNKEPHKGCLFRDAVIEQTNSVLIGLEKPNVLLIGPPGTGKTAIVEHLAHMIEEKHPSVPPMLHKKTIWSLQLSDAVAGTSFRGELEKKIKNLVEYLSDPKNEAILFIDEIHQLNSRDESYRQIAQALKPALSRGKIHVIGATTTQESKALAKDPAFNRRFTRIIVDELTVEQTETILANMYNPLCKHYNTTFQLMPDMIKYIVNVAQEYCDSGSHRPDNAITLLDRCVAAAVINKQNMLSSGNQSLMTAASAMTGVLLTNELIEKTAMKIATGNNEPKDFDPALFIQEFSYIKGQDEIVAPLLKQMQWLSMHIQPRNKPYTMLFMGPSGVGKTEVAKVLAKSYLDQKLITLNMTEYTEPVTINRIIGAPQGYVGYDDNDEMPFDPIITNPYQVILLDEFEKCHRSIQRLFMRIFDEGVLNTNRGQTLDFSKCIIIATTNAGCTNALVNVGLTKKQMNRHDDVSTLSRYFDTELINRFDDIHRFNEISTDTFKTILADSYAKEAARIKENNPRMQIPDVLDDATLDELTKKNYEPAFGARPVRETVTRYLKETLIP